MSGVRQAALVASQGSNSFFASGLEHGKRGWRVFRFQAKVGLMEAAA